MNKNKKRKNNRKNEYGVAVVKKDIAIAELKLFRNIQRGRERKRGLEIIYKYEPEKKDELEDEYIAVKLVFKVFEELDLKDEDLFLVLMSICFENNLKDKVDLNKLTAEEQEIVKKEILEKIAQEGIWTKMDTMLIDKSEYELLKLLRKPICSGKWLRNSLERLSTVFIKKSIYRLENKEYISSSCGNLISFCCIKAKRGKYRYRIGISPYLYSIFTSKLKGFASINLVERFKLKKSIEKDIHRYLSIKVAVGEEKTLRFDRLMKHLYTLSKNRVVNYKHRQNVLKALNTINTTLSFSWQISVQGDKILVKHKKNKLHFFIPELDTIKLKHTKTIIPDEKNTNSDK